MPGATRRLRVRCSPAATREYDAVVPEYVVGVENPGDFPNIVRWLVKHGYSDEEIAKAIGGNTLRVLEQAWIA